MRTETDMPRAADLIEALALLTRLPLPRMTGTPRGGRAAWAWPIAGGVIALLSGIAGALALALGLPPGPAAGLVLAVQVLATGGLHEDGLADSADGLWGGFEPARRLEIMKDSRIGSYGVLALVLALGLRWSALAACLAAGHLWGPLLAAAMTSRAAMAALMHLLPSARSGGLADRTGQPPARGVLIALALAFAVSALGMGLAVLPAALAAAAVATLWGSVARAKIGGQTGDILGAGQQLVEIAVLLVAAALL